MVNELEEVLQAIETIINKLRELKGEGRSPEARAMAVTITMLEQASAYYQKYVLGG